MQPESEVIRFIQTWLIVYMSLAYTFLTGKLVSSSKIRFLLIFPIILLFLLLPLRLTSIYLGSITTFFISFLATFKLILFSFNKGPLSSTKFTLIPFLAAASLPIKLIPISQLDHTPLSKTANNTDPVAQKSILTPAIKYAIKAVFLTATFKLLGSKARLPEPARSILYCFHIYFLIELLLALVGAAARAGLGMELEPQFNEPYLATSLQDFWGRRWNLVVNSILRPTVYQPTTYLLTGPLKPRQAQSIAILSTFVVSGIMHQMIIYHLTRIYPTGQMTCFFVFHGVCVVAERAVAREMDGKWRVPRIVSSGLTILLVISTAYWLFFPEIMDGKLDIQSFQENANIGEFVESVTDVVVHYVKTNGKSCALPMAVVGWWWWWR